MKNSPKFHVNLWGNLQGNLETPLWNAVTLAWSEKRYQDSLYSLLDYVNPQLRAEYGDPSRTTFNVPHGSVVVTLTLNENQLHVTCPFVDITEANRVPLLRKVAEINFHPLTLAQIRLTGNALAFHYSSSLDTCEPFKTYYVLKEICQTADRYDDEFQEKFKAKNLIEPKVSPLSSEQLTQAWEHVNEIISETFEYLTYFDSQRWHGSSLDFLVLAIKRIDLCTQVQGFMKTEFERVNGELANANASVNDRIQFAKKFLQQIQQNGKDAFIKNLYQAEVFIPEKWRTSGEQTKTAIQNALTQTNKYHNEKNYIGSCIESLYCMYDLFYRNNMDHAVNNVLIGSLTNASGKTWEESSGILLSGLQTVANTQYN